MKVMVVVGTRPEIIRLSATIKLLDTCAELTLVHTGQNYDRNLSKIFFEDLNLREPDYYLGAAGTNPLDTVGRIIIEVGTVISEIRPDAFLVLGDTNSCLSAYSAKRFKVPIFHMEAGNRCFDQRVPEEINRKIIDHLADINLTYSSIAKDYLIQEGFPSDRVINIGSPMYEVILQNKSLLDDSKILEQLNLVPFQYFVVSVHREENLEIPENFLKFIQLLEFLDKEYEYQVVISLHPRTRKKIEIAAIKQFSSKIRFYEPFGYGDYLALQKNSKVVLSDSGTISEESSILGFPALNLRSSHERPEAMEEAVVPMVGLSSARVAESVSLFEKKTSRIAPVSDYRVANVAEKVVRIIISYYDYVNANVWRKEK